MSIASLGPQTEISFATFARLAGPCALFESSNGMFAMIQLHECKEKHIYAAARYVGVRTPACMFKVVNAVPAEFLSSQDGLNDAQLHGHALSIQ